MAIYLKKFETQAAYEAAQSDLILPNVSLTVDNNTVHYNPSTPVPPTPSHDYVDLGLPSGTKWATMNVGASSVTDYGNYYQYGKGAATYQETSGDTYYEGVEDPLATSADTATQVWGGQWHMPTNDQFQELIDYTTHEWTTIDEVDGYKFTAQNGNYVFFPAAGYYDQGSFDSYDYKHWSSTPSTEYYAWLLGEWDGDAGVSANDRSLGIPIRPVLG